MVEKIRNVNLLKLFEKINKMQKINWKSRRRLSPKRPLSLSKNLRPAKREAHLIRNVSLTSSCCARVGGVGVVLFKTAGAQRLGTQGTQGTQGPNNYGTQGPTQGPYGALGAQGRLRRPWGPRGAFGAPGDPGAPSGPLGRAPSAPLGDPGGPSGPLGKQGTEANGADGPVLR